MKSCTGCLGRIAMRIAIVVAVLVISVYAIRVAWYDTNSTPKRWACTHLPTLCEHP